MEIKDLLEKYVLMESQFVKVGSVAQLILTQAIDDHKIPIQPIVYRVKSFDSLLKKVKRKEYSDPLNQITDLLGLRAVCLFRGHLKELERIVNDSFNIIKEDDKLTKSEPDYFGYATTHFDATLKQNFPDKTLSKLVFEIQIRTICQNAWSEISRYLDYNSKEKISKIAKRDFYALNGLFYVADTHFELIRNEQGAKLTAL